MRSSTISGPHNTRFNYPEPHIPQLNNRGVRSPVGVRSLRRLGLDPQSFVERPWAPFHGAMCYDGTQTSLG
jgi:uncharacterized protein YijF (DUF1287 family)